MENNKTSLCWNCSNFSKCEWSRGMAIDGWDADRVFVKSINNKGFMTYFVKECPRYKQDKVIRISCKYLCKLLNKSEKYIKNAIHRHPNELDEQLKKIGYQLRRYEGDCYWWLERLD